MKRLNSNNTQFQNKAILGFDDVMDLQDKVTKNITKLKVQNYRAWVFQQYPEIFNKNDSFDTDYDDDIFPFNNTLTGYRDEDNPISRDKMSRQRRHAYLHKFHNPKEKQSHDKSENFQVVKQSSVRFRDIGGYDTIKQELMQCVDMLQHYDEYKKYNIRIPKGLILEGPPGNGKTLLAKGFAGECNCSFIPVSGSEFQEKYVGVGSARVKELFALAESNKPCIIFIDEIDAVGRKRSGLSESSSSERDNTLNQLLVEMDGFKSTHGIFVIGATNRADLLDPALIRPGRIDKRVFIALPDSFTRESILNIHIQGKPHDDTVHISDLVDLTSGMSASQIENVLNEAMLLAIREKRTIFTQKDVDIVMNRILVGWQPTEHHFSKDMIERITVHEMGHAMVGLLAKQHSKMTKIVINLSSPNTPGYTMFEGSTTALYTRESLFEHLMILLAGRIAEEVFYNVSVTTGAINDFEEALKLAEKMVIYYGMGEKLIYPSNSDNSKECIDKEVQQIIHDAYKISYFIVSNCKDIIHDCSVKLVQDRIIRRDELLDMIHEKYPQVLELYTG
jgi:cell division protease FtsH